MTFLSDWLYQPDYALLSKDNGLLGKLGYVILVADVHDTGILERYARFAVQSMRVTTLGSIGDGK